MPAKDDTENKNMKEWVLGWARAGKALEGIKRRELRVYSYQANRDVVEGMLQWAYDHRETRRSSGLVEQQRLFGKTRKRGGP